MPEPTTITIDPEVEEILRSVAADPMSTLLRVFRPTRIQGIFDRGRGVSTVAAGLTSAEQHLLGSFRGEVAWLLREACRMKLIDGPVGRINVSPYRSIHEEHVRWKPQELAEQVEETRLIHEPGKEQDESWAALEQCVLDPKGGDPSVLQLAEASLRLEPTDEARIMAALAMIENGAPVEAIRTLRHTLSVSASQSVTACAWNNLGVAHMYLGQMVTAHSCHTVACKVDEMRPEPWLNRLVIGLQLGLTADAQEMCRVVDGMAANAEGALRSFIRSKELQRERHDWHPTQASRTSLEYVRSSSGPTARRVLSVFD